MRRTWMRGSVVLVLFLVWTAALSSPIMATAAPNGTVRSGVIENCWSGPDTFAQWHENVKTAHGMWKGMPERWVAVFDGRYYASASVLKSEQYHWKSDGTEQYHNAFSWNMYPGLDPASATGWYEFNGVADTVDAISFGTEGFLVSHAAGMGRGTLAGQNAKFTMVFRAWGASTLSLCADPTTVKWNGTMDLEITKAP